MYFFQPDVLEMEFSLADGPIRHLSARGLVLLILFHESRDRVIDLVGVEWRELIVVNSDATLDHLQYSQQVVAIGVKKFLWLTK